MHLVRRTSAAGLVVAFPVDGDHVVAELVTSRGLRGFHAAFGGVTGLLRG